MDRQQGNGSTQVTIFIEYLERFFSFVEKSNLRDVSKSDKTKLNGLYEKFGHLLAYWSIHDKIGYFKNKIDNSFWQDNQMRYIFEDCIVYGSNVCGEMKNLHCTLCNIDISPNSMVLADHLRNTTHIYNFFIFKKQTSESIWNSLFERLAYEKYIDIRVDKTLYCRLCGVVIPLSNTNLCGHINGKNHKKMYSDIVEFTIRCRHNVTGGLSEIRTSEPNNLGYQDEKIILSSVSNDDYTSDINPSWGICRMSGSAPSISEKHLVRNEGVNTDKKIESSSSLAAKVETKGNLSVGSSKKKSLEETIRSTKGGAIRRSSREGSAGSSSKATDRKRFCPKNQFKHNNHFSFYLAGLQPDVNECDIEEGFKKFGEVKMVTKLKQDTAMVKVKLIDGLSSESLASGTLFVRIKGKTYEVNNKEDKAEMITFPQEVTSNFIINLESFIETLLRNAAKESEASISLLGKSMLKTKFVELDLTQLFVQKGWKSAQVMTIGSRASGLAQSDSLHDVFIDLEGDYYGLGKEQDNSIILANRLKDIESVLMDVDSNYARFKNVKNDGNFVYADHIITKLKCKIFCNNGLVVENTQLISAYFMACNTIKQLVLAIKEWAKYTDLPQILSSYAITWMVLNYLLQVYKLIKPVNDLKLSCNGKIESINGWDCGFSKLIDPSVILKSGCKLKTLKELFIGFFQFYDSRKTKTLVHCPLTGEAFLKVKFENLVALSSLPFQQYVNQCKNNSSFKKFNVTKGICIQDPLELNKNLTEKLADGASLKFKFQCSKMVTLENDLNPCLCS